jgi:hypothetical protein
MINTNLICQAWSVVFGETPKIEHEFGNNIEKVSVEGRYFIEVVSSDRDVSEVSDRRKNVSGPSLVLSFSTYYPEGTVEFPGEVYDVALFNVCQQNELVLSIITDNMENRLDRVFDQDDNKIYAFDF